jgi:hypothetical protein
MITRQRDADQQSGRKPRRFVGLLIKLSKIPLTESQSIGYQKPKPRDFQDCKSYMITNVIREKTLHEGEE